MVNRTRSIPMAFSAIKFGNDILASRAEMRLTGEEVQEIAGIERSLIYKYESGKEKNMKMQNFLALCNVYDLDPRDYFELEG